MTIGDSDLWLENGKDVPYPNDLMTCDQVLQSGILFIGHDPNGNPLPNPVEEHLGAGSNKFTFTILSMVNPDDLTIFKSDTLRA